jgi:cyclophilin family peptidyl-prolyl cis-trans isomerase
MVLFAGKLTPCSAAVPVFDPTPVLDPDTPASPPKIPVGKALVIPISATDADGDALSFKVTSSSVRLPARIKSGNPVLRVHVTYAGDGETSPPFSGDLEFQLFRDLTPITTGFIGGAAQAGFYDGQIFHRVIKDFVAQGGDPVGTGSGPSAFTFEHEFQPALIFTGRGQLAMANSNGGYNRGSSLQQDSKLISLGDFRATNGSQFFITFDQPRHLDFKHTIFGQLIRNFELLDKIENVKTPAGDSRPTVEVKMESVTVHPGRDVATLIVGSAGMGSATLTVTATDPQGNTATKEIQVVAVEETVNTPPFMRRLPPIFSQLGTKPALQVDAVDLEFDYLLYGIASAGNGTNPNSIGNAAVISDYTARVGEGLQTLALGVTGFNDQSRLLPALAPSETFPPDPANPLIPFNAYNFQVQELIFGDKNARGEPLAVIGSPGQALSSGTPVARLRDLDMAGSPASFTAQINWGDGTPAQAGVLVRDSSGPAANAYTITGGHTYAKAGIYMITVTGTGNKGTPVVVRSQAVISAGPLHGVGQRLEVKGPTVLGRLLATFTDANSAGRRTDYIATIDWGDGLLSRGSITKARDGSFAVRGSHTYKDPETYAISIRIKKTGAPDAADAIAWSSAALRGFSPAAHVPPFPQAHLVIAWNSGPNKNHVPPTGAFTHANMQVQMSGNFAVVNSGNKASPLGKIRYWLSTDAVLNTTGANPDIRLKVNGVPELEVGSLAPGGGGSGEFTILFPKGESGARKYLISEIVYSDPIADFSPVQKQISNGPIPPTILILDQSSAQTTEAGGSATFKVVLDTAPTANATIGLESTNTAEGTVSPAQLVFTPSNWNTPQLVTVTGVDDAIKDGTKSYKARLKNVVSSDSAYSNLPGREITFSNADNEP